MRPVASAGRRVRIRACRSASSSGAIAASCGPTLGPPKIVVQYFVEIWERPLHGDLPRFDGIQARTSPQVPHGVGSRRARARRHGNRHAQPTHFYLQRLAREPTATHVPRVGGHDATRADHSCHFGNTPGRVGNEKDHQRHDGRIERVVGERQRHRIALTKQCEPQGGPCAGMGQLPLGRVYPLYRDRCAPLDDQFGEGAAAAANVEPSQA